MQIQPKKLLLGNPSQWRYNKNLNCFLLWAGLSSYVATADLDLISKPVAVGLF